MDVETYSAKELPGAAAGWIAARAEPAIAERGTFTLAVSGGSTPAAMFAELARLDLPWSQVHVFQVDERVAPDGDPDRNLQDLRANLLDRVPVVAHLMDVTAADLEDGVPQVRGRPVRRHRRWGARCRAPRSGRRRPHRLVAAGRPGDQRPGRDVALTQPYRGRVRMTLTVPAVNRARSVMFLAAGGWKDRDGEAARRPRQEHPVVARPS